MRASEPQSYNTLRGQISQVDIAGHILLKLLELLSESTFGIVDYHKRAILDVDIAVEVLHQTWNHGTLHHGLRLNWDTRHRHQHLSITFKPHNGRSAHLILYHLT